MRRLDDQGLLMGRQSLNVPPNSQPAGHTGKVCPLNRNRQTNVSLSTNEITQGDFFVDIYILGDGTVQCI